jgi:hypothetical protein
MGSRTHGVWANNGGEDAPLTPRGRRRYHWLVGGVIVACVVLLFVFR